MDRIGVLQGRLTPSSDGSIQFFPKDNWRNEFRLARQIGFDCLELLVKKDSHKENPLWCRPGVTEINELALRSRLTIPSVHGFYSKAEDYPAVLQHLVRQTDAVGARTVLVSFFDGNALKTDEDKRLARLRIAPALRACEETGVCLGIETEMPAAELLDFVESIDHSHIGVYYDLGNMASMGVDVPSEIKLLGRSIYGVHIKDRNAGGGPTVPLGEGCVDFYGAFSALREIGYQGPLIVQGARLKNIDDLALNRRYHIFVKYVLYEIDKARGGKA